MKEIKHTRHGRDFSHPRSSRTAVFAKTLRDGAADIKVKGTCVAITPLIRCESRTQTGTNDDEQRAMEGVCKNRRGSLGADDEAHCLLVSNQSSTLCNPLNAVDRCSPSIALSDLQTIQVVI